MSIDEETSSGIEMSTSSWRTPGGGTFCMTRGLFADRDDFLKPAEEVQELDRGGFDFGDTGTTHRALRECRGGTCVRGCDGGKAGWRTSRAEGGGVSLPRPGRSVVYADAYELGYRLVGN
jgi:hypothetical protein